MFLDRFVNRVLRVFWPEDEQGNAAVRFHSQNLNEDRAGNPKGLPTSGRCWLTVPQGEFEFEWALARRLLPDEEDTLLKLRAQADGETAGLSVAAGLFPVSLFLTVPVPVTSWKERYAYTNANFFNFDFSRSRLRWQFGGGTMSWSSSTPKWKDGSIDLPKLLFGPVKYEEGRDREVHHVQIPMPEGAYDATITLSTDSWSRPRWKTLSIRRCRVDIPLGIPYPGKGENSWDCDEDAAYGLTAPADTVEEAIALVVESVLRKRRERGSLSASYLSPTLRATQLAARRARAKSEAGETES